MGILFVGPMRIPIPSEKGAVENIIWQLSKRVVSNEAVWIFNPLYAKNNKVRTLFAGARILPWLQDKNLIIHSHTPYPSLLMAAGKARYRNHIITLHFPPWISKNPVTNQVLMKTLIALNTLGVTITSPSIFIRDWLADRGINSEYVPNGVDVNVFNPAQRDQRLRSEILGDADFLLVNLGRIDQTKNQLTLLKSFKQVLKERRVKLVLVGPKSGVFDVGGQNAYASAVGSYIRNNCLEKSIEWMGEIPTKMGVAKVLASCDAYVHPSLVEAAPLALLEAMASGLPIVAFNLPYYRGYLQDGKNATLCEPSAESLTDVLISMVNIEVDETARDQQAKSASRFSWDTIIKYYEKLYYRI